MLASATHATAELLKRADAIATTLHCIVCYGRSASARIVKKVLVSASCYLAVTFYVRAMHHGYVSKLEKNP